MRRRLNRELVIAQAVVMADTAEDVTAVSLTALARALEIRPPSLYNHIAGLEDLQKGMAAYGLQQLITDLRQASLSLIGVEALMAMSNAYRQFAQNHPGIYPLTVNAQEGDESDLAALSAELVQMLLLVMASIGLQGDDAVHAIRGLRAILHGFVSLERAGGFKIPLDQEETFRRLIDTYLDGLIN